MVDNDHPVDAALRKLAGDLSPSDEDRQHAASRLHGAMQKSALTALPLRRPLLVGAAVILAVIGWLIISEVVEPSPTVAAIEEIARIAEAADPLTVPDEGFVYTKSEQTNLTIIPREALGGTPYDKEFLVYLLPTARETWVGSQTVQLRTTNHEPIFFTPEDESAYYTAGLDEQDNIGNEVTETVTLPQPAEQWPTDLESLDEAIAAAAAGRDLPAAIEYLQVALSILRETLTTPELRANTLRLMSNFEELQLESQTDQQTAFTIEYQEREIPTRLTFGVSPDGQLVLEQLTILGEDPQLAIPGGTIVSTSHYSEARLVSAVGER